LEEESAKFRRGGGVVTAPNKRKKNAEKSTDRLRDVEKRENRGLSTKKKALKTVQNNTGTKTGGVKKNRSSGRRKKECEARAKANGRIRVKSEERPTRGRAGFIYNGLRSNWGGANSGRGRRLTKRRSRAWKKSTAKQTGSHKRAAKKNRGKDLRKVTILQDGWRVCQRNGGREGQLELWQRRLGRAILQFGGGHEVAKNNSLTAGATAVPKRDTGLQGHVLIVARRVDGK